MTETQIWFEKHRPMCLDDILLPSDHKKKIKCWMEDYKNNVKGTKRSLLLYGDPGIGKTTIANVLLKEFDYDVIEFNASEVRSQKLIRDKINEINGGINILHFMNFKKKSIGIIMDEIDGMSSGDKGGVNELISIMYNKNAKITSPFICISNTLDKKLKKIRDNSVSIAVKHPSKYDLLKVCKRILESEKIEYDEGHLNTIIGHSQEDYRRLLNLLQYIYTDNIDTLDFIEIQNSLNNFEKKHVQLSPYACADKLLNMYKSIEYSLELYEYDKNLVSLLLYENTIYYIVKNRKDDDIEKIRNLSLIYDCYSQADIFDEHIYIHQMWDLSSYNGVLKCSIPSYFLNKKMSRYSCNRLTEIKYSSLINKTSFEYLNYKNLDMVSKSLDTYGDTIFIVVLADVILTYLFYYDYEKGKDLLTNYNITFEEFEKIVKISSLDIKERWTAKRKRELKSFLNN
jgi:replication factor C subunit 1